MLKAEEIIQKYISFFEKRGHKKIPNSPLVPKEDPTTLFTSSGMQPLVPYLLGEPHPEGKRLVNVQNCFRAQDIDEVGDNRHTTFFRMLGNWSLGNYFKREQLPWFFEFLTDMDEGLGLDPEKLYVSVFKGNEDIPRDEESAKIWQELFESIGLDSSERIFYYGVDKNWWSRSGVPENMPEGEPGGPDSEVFYDFGTPHNPKFGDKCHPNCDCGRFLEIGNSVFMQYKKLKNPEGSRIGSYMIDTLLSEHRLPNVHEYNQIPETTMRRFKELPLKNVDFGGGLERMLTAVENKLDIFQTSLFTTIIHIIEVVTKKAYQDHAFEMRIIADHFVAAVFITSSGIKPSNKEQGYILRRLIRRGLDNFYKLEGKDLPAGKQDITPVIETIVDQYKDTDPNLVDWFEKVKNVVLEEEQVYRQTREQAKKFIQKQYRVGDELKGVVEISADDAFFLYSTRGLSPTQIRSLGFDFNEKDFAEKMKQHQEISRAGAERKFKGGLADHEEKTIKGHTATHLLHQALRDVLGESVHQTGSNITIERVRFDFAFDRKLTAEELKKVEDIVNAKIHEDLPVHFEFMSKSEADKLGAIGLFEEKYGERVKIYFIGPSRLGSSDSMRRSRTAYSIEFCGGPHVEHTGVIKRFTITKEEGLGRLSRRIYAIVE